jgi:hypothetical protein
MISNATHQRLIDYLDGKLTNEEQQELELLISQHSDLREALQQLNEISNVIKHSEDWKPSQALRESFTASLQQEMASTRQSKEVFFPPVFLRVAASITLLAIAGSIGFWANNHWREQQELAHLRSELQETKQLMLRLMNNQLSASQRIMGVSAANNITTLDDEITLALVRVLNEDNNTNVRLSALDALAKFHTEPKIKNVLVQSLATQTDPMVQIALIQLLAQIREKTIVPQLENIIDSQQSIKAVKDEAHTALLKLS